MPGLRVRGREGQAQPGPQGPLATQALDALLGRLQVAPALGAGSVDAAGPAWLPPEDRAVPAAAMRLGCEALVAGDRRHFGSAYGQSAGGVAIHSPRSLAEAVLAAGR